MAITTDTVCQAVQFRPTGSLHVDKQVVGVLLSASLLARWWRGVTECTSRRSRTCCEGWVTACSPTARPGRGLIIPIVTP